MESRKESRQETVKRQRGVSPRLARGVKRDHVLSDQQRRMVDHYFGEAKLSMAVAARMAGYAASSAKTAWQLFQSPAVVAEVERRHARFRRRHEDLYERIIDQLTRVAEFNIAEVMDFDAETGEFVGINLRREHWDALSAVGEVKVETFFEGKGEDARPCYRVTVKPWNKLTASDLILRHAGLSRDSKEVHHTVTIEDRLRAGRERARLYRSVEDRVVEGEFVEVESRDSTEEGEDACS